MSTKLDSITTVQADGMDATQQQRILKFLRDNKGHSFSRDAIAEELGIRISSVCGRLNELCATYEVIVCDNVWSAKTNRNVNHYKAAP
jgi:hypothetical protein